MDPTFVSTDAVSEIEGPKAAGGRTQDPSRGLFNPGSLPNSGRSQQLHRKVQETLCQTLSKQSLSATLCTAVKGHIRWVSGWFKPPEPEWSPATIPHFGSLGTHFSATLCLALPPVSCDHAVQLPSPWSHH